MMCGIRWRIYLLNICKKYVMKKYFLLPLVFFCFSAPAQDTLCFPHDGYIKSAGKYKIELGGCSEALRFYLYTQHLKPITNSFVVSGEVEYSYIDETFLVVPVKRGDCNSLQAKIPATGFYKCKLTLHLPHETIWAYFDNECVPVTIRTK